jgi:hypothetical protein
MIETFAIVAIAVHVEARVAHRNDRIVSKLGCFAAALREPFLLIGTGRHAT